MSNANPLPETCHVYLDLSPLPLHSDGSADLISIFAPVGSALLGLSVGDELAWPGPGGKPMTVRVTEVVYQPERAGELHR